MKNPALLVSNPPHDIVDQHEAARCLGLTPAEAGLKANFPAPEVWLADNDRAKVQQAAEALDSVGLRSVIVEAKKLLDLPPPAIAKGVSFEKQGVVATADGNEIRLAYGTRVFGVVGTPPREDSGRLHSPSAADWGRPGGSVLIDKLATAGATRTPDPGLTRGPAGFVDLYGTVRGMLTRLTVTADITDFSAVDKGAELGSEKGLRRYIEECRRLITGLDLDRRLENVRVRRRFVPGKSIPYIEKRLLYSFGSAALSELLASISAELQDTTQYDFGSRLSYLMRAEA